MPSVRKTRRNLRRHFWKEWRLYRQLTQEQAAPRLDIDRTTLGRIENLRMPYNQRLLEAAAEAYKCEPWDLLNVNPLIDGDVVDFSRLVKDASPEDRAIILGFAQGRLHRDTGTD